MVYSRRSRDKARVITKLLDVSIGYVRQDRPIGVWF